MPSEDEDKPSVEMSSYMNPLRLFQAEGAIAEKIFGEFSSDFLIKWLCNDATDEVLENVKNRYMRATSLDGKLFLFPANERLMDAILFPLFQSKCALMLGHWGSAIAGSGLVGEMLATVRFEAENVANDNPLQSAKGQKQLFGRSFDRLPQWRRVELLKYFKLIEPSTARIFVDLAQIRNRYLHSYSEDRSDSSEDAFRAYEWAVRLTMEVLGLQIVKNRAFINPDILAYIKRSTEESDD